MTPPAQTPDGDNWLLTPGPLTTASAVKRAMLHDLGSRDHAFIALTQRVRGALLRIANGNAAHTCVPLQGSGTFAVEALLGTLLPRNGRLLNLVNGAYGRRVTRICGLLGHQCRELVEAEDTPINPAQVDRALAADGAITHVHVVHCETTSGILNPLPAIAAVVARHGRALFVDAMSAFGALPVDMHTPALHAIAASSNKCLEGVPGISFVVSRTDALAAAAGNAHSLSLDLHDQWQVLERNGQWRFTPPVQCLLALDEALRDLEQEGGPAARLQRYQRNCSVLREGMAAMGFRAYLDAAVQAPIIVTFLLPQDPAFHFDTFYAGLNRRGYVIYPGKLTGRDTFRIGCIGRIDEGVMCGLLDAVREVLTDMGMKLPLGNK
ncbi:MAG: 2-aminoethylphosphonate--pyruvate transaminase [Gammaproteobacteria bacterium]|nr:2-aminoethylphosphonate--pyruvate transaminase [Gammaproteobacteria bacterium]